MSKELILQFSIFILSGIPFSLIIILAYARFFSPYNSSLAKATTIITNISGNLIHENLAVKSLIFDKYEAMMDEKSNFTYIENHDTKEDLKLDKRELRKELTMQLIAAISALCHYPKHQEIETVISKFLKNCAMDEKRLGQKYGIITHIPTSEVKKISTIVAIDKESEEIFAFNKGNPSAILERCTRIFLNGKNTGLTSNQIRKLKIQIEKLNQKGEKTIAFAYKPLPKKKLENYTDQFTENDLVLLGIIGLGNYIKDNLYETVENIKKDGIKIYIVSSLKGRKALAIGRDLGIVNPRYFEVISSKDLENIPQEKLRKMIKNKEKDYIFCDITDENRPKIIDALREEGETTAIATKENGLKTIYKNIQKQQQNFRNRPRIAAHALSGSIAKILLTGAAIIFNAPLPFTIATLAFLELAINIPLEFALRKEENPMEEKTYPHIAGIGIIIAIICAAAAWWNLTRFGWHPFEKTFSGITASTKNTTLMLATFGILQIINAVNVKNKKSSVSKNLLTGNMHLTCVAIIAVLIIYLAGKFEFLGLAPISLIEWQIILFGGAILLIIEEVRKYLFGKNEIHQS